MHNREGVNRFPDSLASNGWKRSATFRRMQNKPVIQLLPDQVINKIAAGEVVERPASVMKELFENALDAGATQVDVEIIRGGRQLIAITDNGCGMNRDQALLAIERHATSKIRSEADIENIHTLGFRGEALSSISSVSRFTLIVPLTNFRYTQTLCEKMKNLNLEICYSNLIMRKK